jgi:hypothetical protein
VNDDDVGVFDQRRATNLSSESGPWLYEVTMAWRHTLLVLSFVALLIFASLAEASSCLPSASAVRQEHPGSWPSWTLRAPGHEGVKCWFPASSAVALDHQSESARQISPAETHAVVRASVQSNRHHGLSTPPAATGSIAPSGETLAPQDVAIPSPDENSFADRFDAVFGHGLSRR